MAVFSIPGQQLLANQWLFSSPIGPIVTSARNVAIQGTDPSSQWFTLTGNLKVWGVQMEGYVGGPWDDQAPWAGWGWFLYDAGTGAAGDPRTSLILPAAWTPFGTRRKDSSIRLFLSAESSQIIAAQGKRLRLAAQSDTDIILGLQVTLT